MRVTKSLRTDSHSLFIYCNDSEANCCLRAEQDMLLDNLFYITIVNDLS